MSGMTGYGTRHSAGCPSTEPQKKATLGIQCQWIQIPLGSSLPFSYKESVVLRFGKKRKIFSII